MSRCQPKANPDQLDLIAWAQRWSHKRERWVAHHTLMEPRLYGVEELDHETAFAFLRTHHYARNPAPAASRYGLYRSQGGVLKPELVGVVTFGPGGGERVLNAWTARDHTQALECNRLVLLEDEPYNAESWFVSRALKALCEARPALAAVLSFADPVERKNAAGEVFKPGHIGGIYKALGWSYEGRAKPRTLTVVRETGDVISERTISKITGDEQGWQYGTRQLEAACYLKRWQGESGESFLARCLASGYLVKQPHPGNHAYVWQRDKKRPTKPMRSLPYPVKGV